MSKEFDDIRKKLDQSHKQDAEIIKDINSVDKTQEKIIKEISDIKKEVKNIAFKVDTMLEILNNFSIMLVEDEDEDMLEDYNDNESWIPPEQDEDWNSYDDEDENS